MNLYNLQRFNGQKLICVVFLLCELVNVCYSKILTNSFLVEFKQDIDHATADQIALRNGFINTGPVSSLFVAFHFLPFYLRYETNFNVANSINFGT